MTRLSYRSAGESHGAALTVILEGIPRGLLLDVAQVDRQLKRRQGGAGRGGRQRIESDRLQVTAGLRRGRTIGSPLCLVLENRDQSLETLPEPTRPRPGHADLAGCFRYLDHDIRGTLERASARETAARVAAGAVAAQVLAAGGCHVFGFVRSVGAARLPDQLPGPITAADFEALAGVRDQSRLYTLDPDVDAAMLAEVGAAAADGDTVGGLVEVWADPVLPGLGSACQWSERLDARLAAALVSIPAFKACEIGDGFGAASRRGSAVHDPIAPGASGVPTRPSNRAGGLEGGMTNGAPLVVRGAMKPISTLRRALPSIDVTTGEAVEAGYERSDVCAVPAASVVAEAMVALVLCDATLHRVGGESLSEVVERWAALWGRMRGLVGPGA
ncbi:MAG: chorismate synthase [Planctomycetes bacterium]|nr:chorismate synthase [Planctomycetota bacterium]